jgi:excinuclease UvrABC nuclease subunit
MRWSDWIECEFNEVGIIDDRPICRRAPNQPGVYAIATRTSGGYNVQYIGMSRVSIETRLSKHFSKKGNRIIKALLENKEAQAPGTSMINALYFSYCETSSDEARTVEAMYIKGTNPIGNLVMGSLPRDLRESTLAQLMELDDD